VPLSPLICGCVEARERFLPRSASVATARLPSRRRPAPVTLPTKIPSALSMSLGSPCNSWISTTLWRCGKTRAVRGLIRRVEPLPPLTPQRKRHPFHQSQISQDTATHHRSSATVFYLYHSHTIPLADACAGGSKRTAGKVGDGTAPYLSRGGADTGIIGAGTCWCTGWLAIHLMAEQDSESRPITWPACKYAALLRR
jgi:hypothetical protein